MKQIMEENINLTDLIFNSLNELLSKLFSSIDNSIYSLLDEITFITPEFLKNNSFTKSSIQGVIDLYYIDEQDIPEFEKMLKQSEGSNTYRYRLKTVAGLEWQEAVKTIEEGVVYSLHSFFRKLAQGIGPSCGLMLAGALGFVEANKGNQTFEVAQNMRWLAAGAYTVSGLIMFIGLALVYNLDKKTLAQIDADLKARKAAK
mgnify:CR=1 FL=1